MKIDYEKENTNFVVGVLFEKSEVDQQLNEVAKKIRPQVAPPGFRKNTAPIDVIRKIYRKHILAEASTRLLFSGCQEILKTSDLRNALNPQLLSEYRPKEGKEYAGDYRLDGSFFFKVAVEAPPPLDPQGYLGVEISVPIATFDSWLSHRLLEHQITFGHRTPVDRPAERGDFLKVDFQAEVDGVPLEGGAETDYLLHLGSQQFPAEFEEAFIGRTTAEKFQVVGQFEANSSKPAISGKTCVFQVVLKEVAEVDPHPLDDGLAVLMGFESWPALIETYKDMWHQDFEKPVRAQIYNSIMLKLLDLNPFEVPNIWVDHEEQNLIRRLNVKNFTEPSIRDAIRTMAEKSVRTSYLLDKIYEKEKAIHFTPEEFKSVLEEDALKHGATASDWVSEMKKQGIYEGFVAFAEQQKISNWLISQAKITEN